MCHEEMWINAGFRFRIKSQNYVEVMKVRLHGAQEYILKFLFKILKINTVSCSQCVIFSGHLVLDRM